MSDSVSQDDEDVQTYERRRRVYDLLINSLFSDVEPEDRPLAALAWVSGIQGTTPVDCWAGRCIHYVDEDGHIVSAVLVHECPCGARSARSVGELTKRPFPRKGKR